MRRLRLIAITTLCLAATGAYAAPAEGPNAGGSFLEGGSHHRPYLISVFAGLPYGYGFRYGPFPLGVSGRFYLPLLHDGFIPTANDSFGLEFGADVAFWPGFLAIPVEANWGLHLVNWFALYVKLGLALDLSFNAGTYWWGGARGLYSVGIYPIATLGGDFAITQSVHIRVELGYPWFKVGVSFPFG